ncbi:MAG: threonine/serine exporter family protein, partial [Myxococcota bacterium]
MVQSLADRSVLLDWSRFAVAYARALHGAGLPAPAVEDEVTRVLDARGVASTVMATPTALWVDVDGSRVVRVAPAPAHLARQVGLLAVGDRVADGAAPDVAEAELAALVARPGPWGRVADGIASIGLSAAAATLLGGTVDDVVAAGLLGLGAVAGHRALRDRTRWTWVADGTVALAVSVVAAALGAIGVDPGRTALAALVALAPGMQLATAAAETANGHWASGSARLAGAFVAMVQLGARHAVT